MICTYSRCSYQLEVFQRHDMVYSVAEILFYRKLTVTWMQIDGFVIHIIVWM